MALPRRTGMEFKSYHNQAAVLVKNYLLSDPFIPYTSVLVGVLACKLVYDLSQMFSSYYFKTYAALTKVQRIEWNNRALSSIHAVFISGFSVYFVFWSDLFSDRQHANLITFRSSQLSTFTLGVSAGYFVADLGMIVWLYPSLGGLEYVSVLLKLDSLQLSMFCVFLLMVVIVSLLNFNSETLYVKIILLSQTFMLFCLVSTITRFTSLCQIIHHSLSAIAVAYSMFTAEGQLYTFMVLISEVTTPEINMRWFLDTAGLKKSTAYLVNGLIIFVAWLVARILLFGYMFYHVYLHYEQVMQMHIFGFLLVFVVPSALGAMNLVWFGKILKGLKKTLLKRQ